MILTLLLSFGVLAQQDDNARDTANEIKFSNVIVPSSLFVNQYTKGGKYIDMISLQIGTVAPPNMTIIKSQWDDPLCEIKVFPDSLYVCGDMRVRLDVKVLTGIDHQHEILHQFPPHLIERCTFKLPYTKDWCIQDLTVHNSLVVVLNRLEVSGSLMTRSLSVDSGGVVMVGTRGLLYGNPKFSNLSLFRHYEKILNHTSEFRMSLKNYDDIRREPRVKRSGAAAGVSRDAFFPPMEDPPYHLRCPLVDGRGSIVMFEFIDFKVSRRTNFLKTVVDETVTNNHPYNRNRLMGGQQQQQQQQQFGSPIKYHEIEHSPFGDLLPYQPYNFTVGDLVALRNVSIASGSFVYIYGNLISDNVVVFDGSSLMVHCGHLFLNVTNSLGLTVTGASYVYIGGILESILSRITVQMASYVNVIAGVITTKYIQVFRGASLTIGGEVLTGAMAVAEASRARLKNTAEIEVVLDVVDSSTVDIDGTLISSVVQLSDSSSLNLYAQNDPKVIVASEFHIDKNSKVLVAYSSLLIDSHISVANASTLSVASGGLTVQERGAVRVLTSSKLEVAGDFTGRNASLVASHASSVFIGKSLIVAGIAPQSLLKQYNSFEKRVFNGTWVKNEEEINESNYERARPAIFLESANLTVGGLVEVLEGWVDVAKSSNIKIGKGYLSHKGNSTLLNVRLKSKVEVLNGGVYSGLGIRILDLSQLVVGEPGLFSNELIEVSGGSQCVVKGEVKSNGDIRILRNSQMLNDNNVTCSGGMLMISETSQLNTKSIMQLGGDVLVVDGSALMVQGDLLSRGSVVGQDFSHLKVEGKIESFEGDVISENRSFIFAASVTVPLGRKRRTPESVIMTTSEDSCDATQV